MIHVGYGTQAEAIKLAPIMRELTCRGVEYRSVFTGQHPRETATVLRHFDLPDPDVTLWPGDGVFSVFQAARWGGGVVFDCTTQRQKYRREIFAPGPGICVVHGDTLSTLLLSMVTGILGLKLAHVESGLRSYRWLHPFPEEIVRVLVNRRADLLFAPGPWAAENLQKMRVRGRVVTLSANTGKDALDYTLAKARQSDAADETAGAAHDNTAYALASIHRFETVCSKSALQRAVDVVVSASQGRRMIWPLHTVTRRALEQANLTDRLMRANVETPDALPYCRFAPLLAGAQFVIADGGSIQEESFFLDKPCLLLRHATERREGLGENVVLSKWNQRVIDDFLATFARHRRAEAPGGPSPSRTIVDALVAMHTRMGRARA